MDTLSKLTEPLPVKSIPRLIIHNPPGLMDMPIEFFGMILEEVLADRELDERDTLELRLVCKAFNAEVLRAAAKLAKLDKLGKGLDRSQLLRQYTERRLLAGKFDAYTYAGLIQKAIFKTTHIHHDNPTDDDYKQHIAEVVKYFAEAGQKLWTILVQRLGPPIPAQNYDPVFEMCFSTVAIYTKVPTMKLKALIDDDRLLPALEILEYRHFIFDFFEAAVRCGDVEVVDLLINRPNTNNQETTARLLKDAIVISNAEIVRHILDKHCPREDQHPDTSYLRGIWTTVWDRKSTEISKMLLRKFRHCYEEDFSSLLGYALNSGHTRAISFHLCQVGKFQHKKDYNIKNDSHLSLLRVVACGYQKILERCLASGITLKGGEIEMAASEGNAGIVELLIAHGAHPMYGLEEAAEMGHIEVVRFLVGIHHKFWIDGNGVRRPLSGETDDDEQASHEIQVQTEMWYQSRNKVTPHHRPMFFAVENTDVTMFQLLACAGGVLGHSWPLALNRAIYDHKAYGDTQWLGLVREQATAENDTSMRDGYTDEILDALDEYEACHPELGDYQMVLPWDSWEEWYPFSSVEFTVRKTDDMGRAKFVRVGFSKKFPYTVDDLRKVVGNCTRSHTSRGCEREECDWYSFQQSEFAPYPEEKMP